MENLAVLQIAVHAEAVHHQKYSGAYGLEIYRFMKEVPVAN